MIRPARFEDAAFVYALSQEPSVLRWRIKQEPFTYEQHLAWWLELFQREYVLICESTRKEEITATIPVGYLRAQPFGKGIGSEVSIAVAPMSRRAGVATALLKSLYYDNIHHSGLIHPDNEASIGLFTKCGYVKTGTEMREGKEWLVYVK